MGDEKNQRPVSEKALMIQKIVPSALRNVPRWVLHKNKVPHSFNINAKEPYMFKIDPSREGNKLLTIEEALDGRAQFQSNADGIGFVLDKSAVPAVCIDIDDKELPAVKSILEELKDSYVEESPSGKGLHAWFLDKDTDGISGRRIKGIEIYTAKRFITFTGKRVKGFGAQLAEHNGLAKKILSEYFQIDKSETFNLDDCEADFKVPPVLDDNIILENIRQSKDEKLKLLLDGNMLNYQSPSEADWHCVLKLCFWTGGNAGQIERIISASELGKRHKWQEREDYRRRTIVKAIREWNGNAFVDTKKLTRIIIRQGDKVLFKDKNGKAIEFKSPTGFSVDLDKGIFKDAESDDETAKCICNDVILPLRMFKNADNQTVSVELWQRCGDDWQRSIFPNDTLSTNKEIITLSAIGLDVTSVNARALVTFLRAFKIVNAKKIEKVTAYSQTGWRNKGEFIYPVDNEKYIIDAGREVDLIRLFKPHGERERWLGVYNQFKKYKYCRLAVAASLAAPLLKVLRLRNMTLQFWSQSGQGKTAILKFADSVYKNPVPLLKFSATSNFIEQRCVTLSDFPICVDELKTAERDKTAKPSLDYFAHLIESGASKGRITKNIRLQDIKLFRTIAIITGENPLTDYNSDMGIKRRTVEVHCNNIFDPSVIIEGRNEGSFLHTFSEDNYGLVGQEWINLIKDTDIQKKINAKYEDIRAELLKKNPTAFADHCELLAACITADFFFNQEIAEPDVTPDVTELISIAQQFNAEIKEKDSVRAFDFIRDWFEQNSGWFVNPDDTEQQERPTKFGWIINKGKDDEAICIIPNVIKDALKQAGFNPRKVLTELVDEQLIDSKVRADRGTSTYAIVQRIKNEGVKRIVKIFGKQLKNEI